VIESSWWVRPKGAVPWDAVEGIVPINSVWKTCSRIASTLAIAAITLPNAAAQECPVSYEQLVNALATSVKPKGGPTNGGLDNHMWASVMTRDGKVCAVAFSGDKVGDQWPGSRAIAMEKANTANSLSLPGMAMSTANLFAAAQPGESLYGLIFSSPPAPEIAAGDAASFGTASDPMLGKRSGGVIVFGGGLALYGDAGIVGALGVSGDSSCADHNVAWRVRTALGLDRVPAGVNPVKKDAIIYDIDARGKSASGYGHAKCAGREAEVASELGAGVGGTPLK
jgi:uncharacterized protein GlcG (DUF336 family)